MGFREIARRLGLTALIVAAAMLVDVSDESARAFAGEAKQADPVGQSSPSAQAEASRAENAASAVSVTGAASAVAASTDRFIILAVEDRGEPLPGAGSSPRGDYRRMAGYAGSARAEATAEALAHEYGLREQSAWTIAPLNLRCMLFAVTSGEEVGVLLERLGHDARVRLAQPLNEFETLSSASAPVPNSPPTTTPAITPSLNVLTPPAAVAPSESSFYNDPYFGLQKGFQQMGAAQLQRLSQGARVKIAVIDTGVDTRHPELAGRLSSQRDYATGKGAGDGASERHGTEVMGLIAAKVNNHQGIVGLAPDAVMLSYRACWADVASPGGGPAPSRCNSFTLAQALGAAIADGADVINLSLGGPSDPLLTQLARHAQSRGAIVVAAAPSGRLGKGFPSDVPGALVVASAGEPPTSEGWLAAPGRAVLTTVPGGYDIDTGSSLAAAQVSGVVALLRELAPRADAQRLKRALLGSMNGAGGSIDACAAAVALGVGGLRCARESGSEAARR